MDRAQDVFLECLGGEVRMMKKIDAQEINRIIRMSSHWEDARGVNLCIAVESVVFQEKQTKHDVTDFYLSRFSCDRCDS